MSELSKIRKNGTDYDLKDAIARKFIDGMNVATPQMYGAKGDGITDDTAAIQACFDENNAVNFPCGTYMVSSAGLTLHSNMHITMDTKATIQRIADDATGKPLFVANECENITVEGGKIYGDLLSHSNLSETEYGCHGFNFVHCHNIVLDGVEIAFHMGDSVRIGNGPTPSKNTTIRNCVFHDSHRHGVAVCGVDGFLIEDTEIYGIKWLDEVDFETGYEGYPNTNCRIVGCWFHDPDPQGYSNNSGVVNNDCEGLLIRDCTLHRTVCFATTTLFNSITDTALCGDLNSMKIVGCLLNSLITDDNAKKIFVSNCVFACDDDTKAINALLVSKTKATEKPLDVCIDKCVFVTSVIDNSLHRLFYYNEKPVNLRISNCDFVIRNGQALDLNAIENVVAYNNTVKIEPSVENENPFAITAGTAKNSRISNNIIDACELSATGINGFIKIGTETVHLLNNVVLSQSALGGVYGGNAIRLLATVKNATICGNTFAAYPLLYYCNGSETVVKQVNNTLSGDLTK